MLLKKMVPLLLVKVVKVELNLMVVKVLLKAPILMGMLMIWFIRPVALGHVLIYRTVD
jgi:hypothetical protein